MFQYHIVDWCHFIIMSSPTECTLSWLPLSRIGAKLPKIFLNKVTHFEKGRLLIPLLALHLVQANDFVKVQMKCFFLLLNLKEQQKSGRSPFTVS